MTSAGADNEFTALMRAVYNGDHAGAKELLQAGVNPNARTPRGTTAVMLAVHAGRIECLRALLDAGADPSMATHEGHLPLNEAIARRDVTAIRLLLGAGASSTTYGARGRSPLHEAARIGDVEVVRVLLEGGADWRARSTDVLQWTPRQFAKQGGHGLVLAALPDWLQRAPATGGERVRRTLRSRLADLLRRPFYEASAVHEEEGVVIRILPRKQSDRLLARTQEALALVAVYEPRVLERIRRCNITLWIPGWLPGYGAYEPALKACMLSSEYLLADRTPAETAGTIVHEVMHAQTWTPAYDTDVMFRARSERISSEAQHRFLAKVPGAEAFALAALEQSRVDPIVWARRHVIA